MLTLKMIKKVLGFKEDYLDKSKYIVEPSNIGDIRIWNGERWSQMMAPEPVEPKQDIATTKFAVEAKPDFADAYEGARQDLEIWKKRALEAEAKIREYEKDLPWPFPKSSVAAMTATKKATKKPKTKG